MTDYFALLGVERRPWIDDEDLKARYHAKTLAHHPDAACQNADETAFPEISEAYQTLRDPRRRLQHLRALCGSVERTAAGVPATLQELFMPIGATTQRADALLAHLRLTTNALARGLLHGDTLRAQNDVAQLLAQLEKLRIEAVGELRRLDERWDDSSSDCLRAAERVELTFTYLDRWIAQLNEKQFQLLAV